MAGSGCNLGTELASHPESGRALREGGRVEEPRARAELLELAAQQVDARLLDESDAQQGLVGAPRPTGSGDRAGRMSIGTPRRHAGG
jgi:hypothetical protein